MALKRQRSTSGRSRCTLSSASVRRCNERLDQAVSGAFGGGMSRPQCLQTVAFSWIDSAQNGHDLVVAFEENRSTRPTAPITPARTSRPVLSALHPLLANSSRKKSLRSLPRRSNDSCATMEPQSFPPSVIGTNNSAMAAATPMTPRTWIGLTMQSYVANAEP